MSIAKSDGYKVQAGTYGTHPLTCTHRRLEFGSILPGAPLAAGAIMPRYILEITDHKLHPIVHRYGPSAGGILLLLALPSAADAKRCAAAGIYSAQQGRSVAAGRARTVRTCPAGTGSPPLLGLSRLSW